MSNIKIENPWLLLVAIPLIIVVLVGFFFLPKAKRIRPKNIISLVLHLVMCFTLALSFANIQYLHSNTSTEIYVLADCSDSERDNIAKMDATVADLVKKERAAYPNSKVGVLGFARNVKEITGLGGNFTTVKGLYNEADVAKVDSWNSCSDLSTALLETQAKFSAECVKKIIIVSDGEETDNSALNTVDELIKDDISIDAINLTGSTSEEVAITGINYTDHAYADSMQEIKVSLRSRKAGNTTVKLTSGGVILHEETYPIARGLNIITFNATSGIDTTLPEGQTFKSVDYEVSCTSPDGYDTYLQNNKRSFTQDYTSSYRVLFIGKTETDINSYAAFSGYATEGDNKIVDSYAITDSDCPYLTEDLVKYDEIVLSDVNVASHEHGEELVANLNSAVSIYGRSLSTYGATYSGVNADSYIRTYNNMLPIQFSSDQGKAMVLLIDRSGSMETDSRLTKAKKGAIACLNNLGENDYISIISFSDDAKVHQSLTSAKNKDQVISAINKIKCDGGTELGKGLKSAYNQLKNVTNVQAKYVITLTDGEPFDTESSLKKNIKNYAADNIVFSFINISCADGAALLKRLTTAGNGTYYYCKTASQLVDVMLTSIAEEVTNFEQDQTTTIQVRESKDPTLVGVNTNAFPELHGFNYCRVRPEAETVLTVQYKAPDTKSEDGQTITGGILAVPLYAYWNYGKGKVTSFSSSITNDSWTYNFRESSSGKAFLANAVANSKPARAASSVLDMKYTNHGKDTTLSISANDGDMNAKVQVTVTDPNGTTSNQIYTLRYDGSYYTGSITTGVAGKYSIDIKYYSSIKDGDNVTYADQPSFTDVLPLYYDYSIEYDVFSKEENNLLYNITKKSSGTMYAADNIEVVATDSDIAYMSYVSTMFPLLIVSLVLFLADVFVRKSDFKIKKKVKQGM